MNIIRRRPSSLSLEAGYPNGFKTEVLCLQENVNELSILKAYFAKVGVDMALVIKERAVFNSMRISKQQKQMLYRSHSKGSGFYALNPWRPGTVQNDYMSNDGVVEEAYNKLYSWEIYKDKARTNEIYREVNLHILAQAYSVQFPCAYMYTMWWPWVKNYHGELKSHANVVNWYAYPWIDQDLKQTMTGRR